MSFLLSRLRKENAFSGRPWSIPIAHNATYQKRALKRSYAWERVCLCVRPCTPISDRVRSVDTTLWCSIFCVKDNSSCLAVVDCGCSNLTLRFERRPWRKVKKSGKRSGRARRKRDPWICTEWRPVCFWLVGASTGRKGHLTTNCPILSAIPSNSCHTRQESTDNGQGPCTPPSLPALDLILSPPPPELPPTSLFF